eukprot:255394-Alexandrium_andersonii.AAC.1
MTSKELSEGVAESFKLAQNDSAVIQSDSHDTWFNSLRLGDDKLHYFTSPGGRAFHEGCNTKLAIERVH